MDKFCWLFWLWLFIARFLLSCIFHWPHQKAKLLSISVLYSQHIYTYLQKLSSDLDYIKNEKKYFQPQLIFHISDQITWKLPGDRSTSIDINCILITISASTWEIKLSKCNKLTNCRQAIFLQIKTLQVSRSWSILK